MPSIKKAEYERLKVAEQVNQSLVIKQCKLLVENLSLISQVELFKKRLEASEQCRDNLAKALENTQWDADRWRRYYKASIETFRIEDALEIPGCFKPQDSIEYIISKQEASDGSDHNA